MLPSSGAQRVTLALTGRNVEQFRCDYVVRDTRLGGENTLGWNAESRGTLFNYPCVGGTYGPDLCARRGKQLRQRQHLGKNKAFKSLLKKGARRPANLCLSQT